MARVYTREGKKGIQIYYDFVSNGVRVRKPSGIFLHGNKAVQKKLLAEALVECEKIEKGEKLKSDKVTVVEYLNKIITAKDNNYIKNKYIDFLKLNNLHNITVDAITKQHCKDYLEWLIPLYRASTVVKHYAVIRAAFSVAIDDELRQDNPFFLSKKQKTLIWDKHINKTNEISCSGIFSSPKAFTIDELRYLLKFLKTNKIWNGYNDARHYLRFVILLVFLCNGRRINEIDNLRWSDIDWEKRMIHFYATKNKLDCYVYIGPKLERLLKILKNYSKNEYVVVYGQKFIQYIMRDSLIRSGLYSRYETGMHSIRRTVLTLLTEKFDFVRADVLIGHKPSTVGAKHYYKPTESLYKEASVFLESLIDV